MFKENTVIRKANLDDASRVLQIQNEVVAEDVFLTTSSDEFNKTVKQQRDWMEKIR